MSSIDKKKEAVKSRNTAAIVAGVLGLFLLWWFYPQIRAAVDPMRGSPSVEEAAAPAPGVSEAGAETEAEAAADGEAEADTPGEEKAAAASDPATSEAAPDQTARDGQSEAASADTPTEPMSNALAAPKFDVVRIEDDGSALIAGQAAGRGYVILSVDGVEQPEARADLSGNGQFVMFAFLPPTADQQSQKLHLYAEDGSGPVVSVQTVFVAPATVVAAATQSPESTVAETEPPVAEAEPPVAEEVTASEGLATENEAAATEVASTETKADPAPATVILADEDGVRVLQDGAPSAAKPAVTIDTISYSSNGAVILGGRGQSGNFVRIYLDNQSIATSKIAADGYWSLELSDIEPGIYTLRVDELNAAGDVVSRAETPFKREAAEELANLMAADKESEEVSPAAPSEQAAASETVDADADSASDASPAGAPKEDTAPEKNNAQAVTQGAVTVQPEVAGLGAQDEQSSEAGSVATEGLPAETAAALRTPSLTFRVRTVQPGSTLWAIAKESYGAGIEYFKVFEANKERIRDPDLIYPGQVFEIPD